MTQANSVEGKRPIRWGAGMSKDFLLSVVWIEEQLGISADKQMTCMKQESNLKATAKNPYSSGRGLIQFMDATVAPWGLTSTKQLPNDPVKQLSFVYKYFNAYRLRGFHVSQWTLNDVYMSILWPAAIGKPDDYMVFVNDLSRLKDAYDVNRGLDVNKDGHVTKTEACARLNRLYVEGGKDENLGYI